MPAESISWRSYWIEAHQRRLVAWCYAQGGVSGIRVSADDKGVELAVEVDERRAQSMFDDSSRLFCEHRAVEVCKIQACR